MDLGGPLVSDKSISLLCQNLSLYHDEVFTCSIAMRLSLAFAWILQACTKHQFQLTSSFSTWQRISNRVVASETYALQSSHPALLTLQPPPTTKQDFPAASAVDSAFVAFSGTDAHRCHWCSEMAMATPSKVDAQQAKPRSQ